MAEINWLNLEKEYGIPSGDFNLFEIIERRASENSKWIALNFQTDSGKVIKFTYGELIKKVNQYSNFFKKNGLKKGERVALFLPKCPEVYFGILAVIKIGAIAMPLFEAFQPDGLELRLRKGDVNFLLTDDDLLPRYKKIKKPKTLRKAFSIDSKSFKEGIKKASKECNTLILNRKDACMMIFTSSTAGTPVAGIMLPHQGSVQWMYTGKEVLGLESGKEYFCSAHPAWVTGAIYGVLTPFLIGAENYSIQGRFDVSLWKEFISSNKIQNIYTAPTVLRLLKGNITKKDLKSVKRICSVGEALPWSIVEHYMPLGVKIVDTYWQTEIGAIVVANIDLKEKALGKPIGVDAFVKNGEIILKTPWPAMMTDIWKHKKMFESYFDGKNFKTHDSATEKQGHFYFEGRKDDIIKTSGERVSPLEIENILMKYPAVKECAIIGVPDQDRGSILKAFIVLNKKFIAEDKLKQEISDFVKKNYAGHAYPKIIEFLEELPKGNSGKIIRAKLK